MVEISVLYEGKLHCVATHGPTGKTLQTDAPLDNHGKGATFSPTDLVATALGACIGTVMAIVAERHKIELSGMQIHVEKHMSAEPRRIGRLPVSIYVPVKLDDKQKAWLERAAHTCPVHASLHPDIDAPILFHYPK